MFVSLRNLGWTIVGSIAAGLVTMALASAHDGPPASGVIHACVNHNSGTVKIVEEEATCKNNESALDWNAEGAAGAPGADGEDGANGVSGYVRVVVDSDISDVPSMIAKGLQIDCPSGKRVLGGGSQAQDFMVTIESYPISDTAWFVRHLNISNTTLDDVLITGYAICADVTP